MIQAVSGRTALQYTPQWSAGLSILHSDKACFSLCFRLFQGVLWCISGPDMVHITCRYGVFRVSEKSLLYISL